MPQGDFLAGLHVHALGVRREGRAADSAAAFSRAAFSPSFLTSLAVSLPASGGAGGGMTLADGAGESTFVSGALAASEVFGASATFTGSGAPFGSVAGVAVTGAVAAARGAFPTSRSGPLPPDPSSRPPARS